jgi:hypothetical protein
MFEELGSRFVGGVLGHEPALARGFEDAGPVAFQGSLRPFESSHHRVEPGELGLDFVHDALLFGERGEGDG